MSFYTALTGLKGAQTDISTTSNNIANVGSNGFKKSRTEFGDIFGSTPLQTNAVGAGTTTKAISQQFSQGNITQSTNTLDMAISGQGFFAVQASGNSGQVVYTRNGSFDVSDEGFIVDSAGQFLLGYPVDTAGGVSDKTLEGATKMQLASTFGNPVATENINMGINLPSGSEVISPDIEFDVDDSATYSASSSVTIFDNAGNPKSATVYYVKTQNPSAGDASFKYDTKLFVDGVELQPTLTRSADNKGVSQFIDKFGQKTATPSDPAYILEGKGSPLYRADDLGAAQASTPAVLSGLGLETYLGDGRTVEVVTDPMKFKKTMEYQSLQGVASPVPGTFWGKDFLLVDVDNSGPVSIDIPPGTYNGEELAAAVEVAMRDAFGDDKKVQLTSGEDNILTIDLKKSSGDGKSTGLASPVSIDLNAASIVSDAPENGLTLDTFLVHAQRLVTNQMNAQVQGATANLADETKSAELGTDGRLFKQVTAGDAITAPPTDFDVINVAHTNTAINAGAATSRYIAYSNVGDTPSVKAYDEKFSNGTETVVLSAQANTGLLTVAITGTSAPAEDLSVLRFQQRGTDADNKIIDAYGAAEISIKSASTSGNTTTYVLDVAANTTANTDLANQDAITILGQPSKHIEAFFGSTEGLVEGVDEAYYSNKLVVREIGDSAKRTAAQANTNATAFVFGDPDSGAAAAATFGLSSVNESVNWVDDRDPAVKIGYDETNQRLTFDAVNGQVGKGTGLGFDSFTVYGSTGDTGENSLGIPTIGENPEISLQTDDLFVGGAFIPNGPDVRAENRRFGMEVEFDTVNNVFDIRSGTTGEALGANSVVGVDVAQNASSVAVGRYNLTNVGARDATDTAEYSFNKIGTGGNQIMGFPRDGVEGYTDPTGLVSKPASTSGSEALPDMSKAFTISSLGGENVFNTVVNGVSASIVLPEGNYKGSTLAEALETRINAMSNPVSGQSIGGVTVEYNQETNNLTFTTATMGEGSTIAIEGALRFGLSDVPLGLGETASVRKPVQATDEFGRPLYIAPNGEITANNQDFADNMVEDFYPLYLDEGEITFDLDGNVVSPITKVTYAGALTDLTLDFSSATQLDQAFSADAVEQDGYSSGRLTNMEIDNYGNVSAGYSNGQNVTLGKIMLASFQNQSGLKQIGNSSFIATAASGDPELGEAAADGFGQILSGSLERSNVDITEELVNLITSQRNYQAAAKAIETSSSMTQTIINIRT
jgi:flagellar hook protein FlgE